MRRGLVALALLVLTLPATAGGAADLLPSRFDVSGVAASDTLNVRAEPTTSAPVIATLAPDTRGVEVVATDPSGRWGRVNAGEASGWVALRYLREEPDVWTQGALPAGFQCFGTEPFWSLVPASPPSAAPGATTARIETPEGSESFAQTTLDLGHPGNPRRALVLRSETKTATATITPQLCSDGMSDQLFGLEALVVVDDGAGPRLLSGCCSVAAR